MTSHAKSSRLSLAANLQLVVFTTECQLAITARRDDFACEVIQRRCEGQKVEALQARQKARKAAGRNDAMMASVLQLSCKSHMSTHHSAPLLLSACWLLAGCSTSSSGPTRGDA